ncbi:alpha-N-acetylglucosaminidase-like isoform X2 [Hydractinia symbiolongicarpus]|uniref:alpha-N-acetylglucosaminidase-like isoform X2 n=1 Tax=Hydractinia symbiolongicarpus TaxID=13093 RepID=UPI00254EFC12|nr:alpha-N-acetylglucosaminidase-like isoform X2 [Hydractinia symbiolongicarpus]
MIDAMQMVFGVLIIASLRHIVRCSNSNKFALLKSKTLEKDQVFAVQKLIQRLIPKHADGFVITLNASYFELKNNLDAFEFRSLNDGKISITATSGVAAAAGFYHYLKYWCNCHVSWSGDQLNMPSILPSVSQPVTKYFQERFRYYQNVCTVSYSMAFWNWSRWEREIDWMALNGINLPLAFTAQETVWQKVYIELGLTQEELDSHFAGPAFLAWQRMGNIDGWGGPLPASWYQQQMSLQQNILKRMRSLGMMPVLPGFAGHIPKALVKRLYPEAKYYNLKNWGHFSSEYSGSFLLKSEDDLFQQIGSMFIKAQQEIYNGTDHIYNADVFNEMKPPKLTTDFMYKTSKSIFQSMLSGDPNAVWLMQTWMFCKSYWTEDLIKSWLTVPIGRLILLDLASDIYPIYNNTNGYYGHPFIWSMIENFGGTTRLYGKVEDNIKAILSARNEFGNYMVGTGMTPEGIEQNDVNFEIMNEMAWRNSNINMTKWIKQYAFRRYGVVNDHICDAWQMLLNTVYNCHSDIQNGRRGEGRIPVIRPYITSKLPVFMWYNPKDLFCAWTHMIAASQQIQSTDAFRYDLVKFGTQVLEDLSIHLYYQLIKAYEEKDLYQITNAGRTLIDLLNDMDTLLSTDRFSLLGTWIGSAKNLGENMKEKRILEYNARIQITLWGPNGEIHDYANKNWAGLIQSYYTPRWKMFIDDVTRCVYNNVSFSSKVFGSKLLSFEQSWTKDISQFPSFPTGSAFKVSEILLKKYAKYFDV